MLTDAENLHSTKKDFPKSKEIAVICNIELI
jgi:hypothetical protein